MARSTSTPISSRSFSNDSLRDFCARLLRDGGGGGHDRESTSIRCRGQHDDAVLVRPDRGRDRGGDPAPRKPLPGILMGAQVRASAREDVIERNGRQPDGASAPAETLRCQRAGASNACCRIIRPSGLEDSRVLFGFGGVSSVRGPPLRRPWRGFDALGLQARRLPPAPAPAVRTGSGCDVVLEPPISTPSAVSGVLSPQSTTSSTATSCSAVSTSSGRIACHRRRLQPGSRYLVRARPHLAASASTSLSTAAVSGCQRWRPPASSGLVGIAVVDARGRSRRLGLAAVSTLGLSLGAARSWLSPSVCRACFLRRPRPAAPPALRAAVAISGGRSRSRPHALRDLFDDLDRP